MKTRTAAFHFLVPLLVGLAVFVSGFSAKAQNMSSELTPKQIAITLIGAFTANGNRVRLEEAFNNGLDAGLTVNEIKEIITQMYAYVGFPRALNATAAFLAVTKARTEKGIHDEDGKEPTLPIIPDESAKYDQGMRVLMQLANSPVPLPKGETDLFIPAIEVFLKEHLFADIFGRDNLDFLSREIATAGALGALEGVEPMLTFHLGAAMNVGLSENQARGIVELIREKVGEERGECVGKVLDVVLGRRK